MFRVNWTRRENVQRAVHASVRLADSPESIVFYLLARRIFIINDYRTLSHICPLNDPPDRDRARLKGVSSMLHVNSARRSRSTHAWQADGALPIYARNSLRRSTYDTPLTVIHLPLGTLSFSWNLKTALTSCAGTTCHARPKIAILSQFYVKQNRQNK